MLPAIDPDASKTIIASSVQGVRFSSWRLRRGWPGQKRDEQGCDRARIGLTAGSCLKPASIALSSL